MKPKTEFDPMFATSRRRQWPVRAIGMSVIVAALSGLALRAGPIPPGRPVSPLPPIGPMPGGYTVVQGPGAILQPGRVQPRDRFVIVAPAEIDPQMVVRARDDIDPKMVVDPEAGRLGSTPGELVPRLVPAPTPGSYQPLPSSPRPRTAPRPR